MWEQLMQMLSSMPQQNIPLPTGGGAAPPVQAAAPPGIPQQLADVSKAFQKGVNSMPAPAPPQVSTPQAPRPQPYQPGQTPGGLGSGGGGDITQMLLGLPGMAAMLGQGAGGGMPQGVTGLGQQAGAGVPSLGELMSMQRRQ